jgi:DNA-binding CsgD family transcriptional regulator
MRKSNMSSKEKEFAYAWVDELQFAQSLADVQAISERPFSKVFQADYSAICLSLRGDPTQYEWQTRMSAPLLADYSSWAHEDFVLNAVMKNPNVPLRDTDMLRGEKVENTYTFRLSRERGMRLKHVLSVGIVRPGETWHGGITLYSERRPFPKRRQALLEWARRRIENSFWNIRRFADAHRGQLLEIISGQSHAALVLTPLAEDALRTPHAAKVLERWFTPSELGPFRVPLVFSERLTRLVKMQGEADADARLMECPGRDGTLRVEFNRLPPVNGRSYWELKMREIPHPLPRAWRERLSTREIDIAIHLLQGGQNEDIAESAGCAVGTVKKHLGRIYRKVGADSRADFISRALMKE